MTNSVIGAWHLWLAMLFHILAFAFAVYTTIEHSSLAVGIVVWAVLIIARIAARILVL
jgi:hypothetical protein